MRTTLWSSQDGDIPANLALTNNYNATTAPTVNDDASKNYSPGSIWINTATGQIYTMTDSTKGAAVWTRGAQTQGLGNQASPIALTAAATLTAAQILIGLLTSNPAGGVAVNYQLPDAADLDTALPTAGVNSCFDFTLVSISTVAAEDATITTNNGWTLVGSMVVASNAAATDKSAGRFRARKTGTAAWSLYRLA